MTKTNGDLPRDLRAKMGKKSIEPSPRASLQQAYEPYGVWRCQKGGGGLEGVGPGVGGVVAASTSRRRSIRWRIDFCCSLKTMAGEVDRGRELEKNLLISEVYPSRIKNLQDSFT